MFFTCDFTDDLTPLPCFTPGDLFNLVKNSGKNLEKYRHLPVVDRAIDKGFYMKNLVHDLQTSVSSVDSDIVYVRSLCWASMSKSTEYKVHITVSTEAAEKVLQASCDKKCPARYVNLRLTPD